MPGASRNHGPVPSRAGPCWPFYLPDPVGARSLRRHPPLDPTRTTSMGKGILLWLLGIPLPIIIILVLFWR